MSVSSFIPQIWAADLIESLHRNVLVYADLGTTEWEGEIKNIGDTVRLNTIGRISVGDYNPASTTITYEDLNTADQTLQITEYKFFAFQVHDADEIQAAGDFRQEAMREAAWSIGDVADIFIAEKLRDDALVAVGLDGVANYLGTRNVGTGATDADMYETLVDMRTRLRRNNVPMDQSWVVVPPEAEGLLLKDPRYVSFGTTENRETIRTGAIGRMSTGMEVFVSNNTPLDGSSDPVAIAGYMGSFGYAEQIPEGQPEALRLIDKAADGIRGFHLYGAKVVRPYTLASVSLNFV